MRCSLTFPPASTTKGSSAGPPWMESSVVVMWNLAFSFCAASAFFCALMAWATPTVVGMALTMRRPMTMIGNVLCVWLWGAPPFFFFLVSSRWPRCAGKPTVSVGFLVMSVFFLRYNAVSLARLLCHGVKALCELQQVCEAVCIPRA